MKQHRFGLAVRASLSSLALVSVVTAQPCEPHWLPGFQVPGLDSSAGAVASWDPDGEGPKTARLVIGGSFSTAGGVAVNRIALWDGVQWMPLGSGMNGPVYALISWDPDGTGPLPPQLVAGGSFTTAGGVIANNIARWDGIEWRSFDQGVNDAVHALIEFDPDGDGPLLPEVIAGGDFTTAGGIPAYRIARWEEEHWQSMQQGVNARVRALEAFDSDASGPIPAMIVAGGDFTVAADLPVNRIAVFDSGQWRRLGVGLNSAVYSLRDWDPDGDGPQAPKLVAGGTFSQAGGAPAGRIAQWDGAQWSTLGSGVGGVTIPRVNDLIALDLDGPGSQNALLLAAGSFLSAGGTPATGLASWDGIQWAPYASALDGSSVLALAAWDPDGTGSQPLNIVATGSVDTSMIEAGGVARWDGQAWHAFGAGVEGSLALWELATWDPGGQAARQTHLLAAGGSSRAGGIATRGIARWNGTEWSALGAETPGEVSTVATWDPDGDGGQLPNIIAGGGFTTIGSLTVNGIARWDGQQWHAFGSGVSGGTYHQVFALTTWDPDGMGPELAQVVAAGDFVSAGGSPAARWARWNGTQWLSSGTPLGLPYVLQKWDPDGNGPMLDSILFGGLFVRVSQWTGTSWTALGGGTGLLNQWVFAMTTWDPDGEGPQSAQIVIGGDFTIVGNLVVNRIARWDGQQWHPFGLGANGVVHGLTSWDPDGTGPRPPLLIAAGNFTSIGGVQASRIAKWEQDHWSPLGSGLNEYVYDVHSWDSDGPGPVSPVLVAVGSFSSAGGEPSSKIAMWREDHQPALAEQPAHTSVACGSDAVLSAVPAWGHNELGFQWRRNGTPLVEGPTSSGSIVSGSHAAVLRIAGVSSADEGAYDVVLSNACATATSMPAMLSVHGCPPTCDGDVNCDGVLDVFDIEVMERAIGGDMTDFCQADPDFNQDWSLNGFDVEAVNVVTGGGPCP